MKLSIVDEKLPQSHQARLRLRALREQKGASLQTIAAVAGLTVAGYDCLDSFDEEIFGNISINRLNKICNFLDIKLFQLVAGMEAAEPTVSLNDLALKINAKIAKSSLGKVEDAVGWDLKAFLKDRQAALEYPLQFIQDVCRVLKIEWVTAIPN